MRTFWQYSTSVVKDGNRPTQRYARNYFRRKRLLIHSSTRRPRKERAKLVQLTQAQRARSEYHLRLRPSCGLNGPVGNVVKAAETARSRARSRTTTGCLRKRLHPRTAHRTTPEHLYGGAQGMPYRTRSAFLALILLQDETNSKDWSHERHERLMN